MLKITSYLNHAEECRRMAKRSTDPKHRKALLQMAQTWVDLATSRAETKQRQKRISKLSRIAKLDDGNRS